MAWVSPERTFKGLRLKQKRGGKVTEVRRIKTGDIRVAARRTNPPAA